MDPIWERTSSDPKVNAHGRALRSVMNGLHMLVLNGMKCFQKSDMATCFPASGGCSVLDLALVHVNTMGLMKGFSVEDKQPKSDHAPIVITMGVGHERQQKGGTQINPTYRLLQEKKGCYVD